MRRLAVILTCHNRRATTVRCLESLAKCKLPLETSLELYLTDDGCTDGTIDAALSIFPDARISTGTGDLYWGGGMRLGMMKAIQNNVDFMLWLNDDVVLNPSSLVNAFANLSGSGELSIIIGSTENIAGSGVISYGGVERKSSWRPMHFVLADPRSKRSCQTMNGQFVLIPSAAFTKIGLIDTAFRHTGGDFDYGYRAVQAGVTLRLLPDFVGVCPRGPSAQERLQSKRWRDYWRAVGAPTGMPPAERYEFCRRYGGGLWIIHWLWPYVKLLCLFPLSFMSRSARVAAVTEDK